MTLPPCVQVRNEGRYNTINGRGPAPLTMRPAGQIWTDLAGQEGRHSFCATYHSRHLAALETCSTLPVQVGDVAPQKDEAAGPAQPLHKASVGCVVYSIYIDPLSWRIACEAAWTQHISGCVLLHAHASIYNPERPFPRFHLPFDLTQAPSIPVSS